MAKTHIRENFHQAKWDEPLIYDLSTPGVRGIIPAEVEDDIIKETNDAMDLLPESLRRESDLDLPEVDQKHVLAHWLHLSQQTMGSNISNDLGEGTCTMKYNPRLNEKLVLLPGFAELHPDQDPETVQGMLEIYAGFEDVVREVSGLDLFSLQPGGGNHAVYTAASIIRAYHDANGEGEQRDEVITTIFSHPSDAATPATAGYKIITIYPDENGIPDVEAIRAAANERTAAIFMTNPEDLGIYNPKADEIVEIIHDVGGLCFYDQANANAFMGIARAKEAGFDMCHFNVHKTFGTPHGCSGPASGALGCREFLKEYLPWPLVKKEGDQYVLNYDLDKTIGKVRQYVGSSAVILKAYAWSRNMGPDGLKLCSEISVINNNYLQKLIEDIPYMGSAYQDNGIVRQEQIRYTFEKLTEKTGVGSEDMNRRMLDRGLPWFWSSHHPWVIPEPMTLEPCETYSKADMEEWAEVIRRTVEEALEDPEFVKNAPYRSVVHKRKNEADFDDPEKWATTYKAYKRKILDKQ